MENDAVSNDQSYDVASQNSNFSNQTYDVNNQTDWRANLSPELQPVVQRYNDLEGFVRAFRDTQSFVGKKVNDFSTQDWQTYNAMMSQVNDVPVSPHEYQIDTIPINGEAAVLAEEDTAVIKELSHSLGLNTQQAQAFHDALNTVTGRIMDVQQQYVQDKYDRCMENLYGAWGNAFEGKINAINNAITNILQNLIGNDSESIRDELFDAGIYNSPTLMKTLSAIGELTMDSTSRGYNNIAPMDAQSRYSNMRSDPDFMRARIDPHHPMHQQVKQEFAAMCEAANG